MSLPEPPSSDPETLDGLGTDDTLAGDEPPRVGLGTDDTLAGNEPRPSAGGGPHDTLAGLDPQATLAGEAEPVAPRPRPRRRRTARTLRRGDMLGRYVVLDTLGQGAMGVVLAAYDPELDRKVAIKLVRALDDARHTARLRLQREAQAIAKLSHPNVVHVHDVGVVDEQVFIAMELVEGRDLRRWLDQVERAPEQILGCLLQAGAGLAAAHEAGLVHRDFKPDNVLVGDDGRVRVVDFGLARTDEWSTRSLDGLDEDEARAVLDSGAQPISGSVAIDLTATGALLGTPAYMAPEQFSGQPGDARSDQFSFCVTVYEALCGTRPFDGETVPQLARALLHDAPVPPPASRVSSATWRALRQGLDPDPARRHPSMPALLAALRRAAAPRRRLGWALAGVAVAGTLGALAWPRPEPPRPCDELVERAAATWSPARTAELEARFLALDLPYAADTWRRVREGVSTHVERWAALQRETCEAARVDAEAAPVLAQRQECLDERLREVGVLLEVLDEADPHTVESAAELVASLSELEACLDDEHLRERLVPADPWRRARVQQLRSELDRARMLYEAGRLDAARMELLAQGAAELDYLPFTAELTLLQAETTAEADFDRALELANLAFEQALASRHDEIAFEASAHLGHLYGSNRLERGEAERWIRRAEAMLHRLGDDEHETLTVLNLRAVTLAQTGALSEASEDYQELVERHRRIGERRNLAAVLNNAGNVEFTLGRVDEGLAMLEESLRLSEQEWGPDHPKSLRTAANLGIMMVARGELDEGRRRLEAIVPPQEAALGSDSPELANSLESLAVAYARLDRLELAGTMRRRVLEIREHAYGADSVPALSARGNLAYQLELEGKPEEALRLAKEVVATNEARDEPALRVSLHALVTATDVAVELGRADEAWSLAQRLDQTCAAADPCSPQIHRKSQLLSGMALLLGGKPEAAVPLLEEVVRDPADEGLLPMAQFQLARALASDPARRAEAIALARRAAGPANEGLRKKITAWLAEQGR